MGFFRRGVVTDEYRTQMQATEKYNSATVPPLVVMQPGMDTLNKHYSMEVSKIIRYFREVFVVQMDIGITEFSRSSHSCRTRDTSLTLS